VAFLRLAFPHRASNALSQRINLAILARQSASVPACNKFFAVYFNPRIHQQLLVCRQLTERYLV
jgi:hypothetical protein